VAADAYLAPTLASYLGRLADRIKDYGFPLPMVMQSSGGVTDLEVAARHAASGVLSGPAGGVRGADFVADLSGAVDLLTFDMGGTSTDVVSVLAGQVTMTASSVIGGGSMVGRLGGVRFGSGRPPPVPTWAAGLILFMDMWATATANTNLVVLSAQW
jgi:N-methylhydantoinase A/oxoprolinase/acetone carboxylase beta subunit